MFLSKHWLSIGLLILWTAIVWYKGFEHGRGEQSVLQKRIDNANTRNLDLSLSLIKAEQQLIDSAAEYEHEIAQWRLKHRNVKPAPASKCVGTQDYFGKQAADKFLEEHERKLKNWQ